jgi:hypothetical protein
MARGRQQKPYENLLTREDFDELIRQEQAQAARAINNHEEDNEGESRPHEGGVPVISEEPRDSDNTSVLLTLNKHEQASRYVVPWNDMVDTSAAAMESNVQNDEVKTPEEYIKESIDSMFRTLDNELLLLQSTVHTLTERVAILRDELHQTPIKDGVNEISLHNDHLV